MVYPLTNGRYIRTNGKFSVMNEMIFADFF